MDKFVILRTEARPGSKRRAFAEWLDQNPGSAKKDVTKAGHSLLDFRFHLDRGWVVPGETRPEGGCVFEAKTAAGGAKKERKAKEQKVQPQARGEVPAMTNGTLELFLALVEDACNWSGTPLFGQNVESTPARLGHLTDLKKKGLLTTNQDEENPKCFWVNFTPLGIKTAHAYDLDPVTGKLEVEPVEPKVEEPTEETTEEPKPEPESEAVAEPVETTSAEAPATEEPVEAQPELKPDWQLAPHEEKEGQFEDEEAKAAAKRAEKARKERERRAAKKAAAQE